VTRYSKFIVALIPALLAALKVLSDALGDGSVSTQEWIALAVAALAALGVYGVRNVPPKGQAANPNVSEVGP
jgi:hypothetical protein